MSFNIGGVQVPGAIVKAVENLKQPAQQAIQSMINEAKSDPARSLKQMQQPSGLSCFLDIKI